MFSPRKRPARRILRVLKDHVVPNGLAPIVTDATILMGAAILTEAGLSFLGLGDQNQVSWGRMIFEAQRQLRLAPWISIFPGVCMLILVAAFNLLGDGINHALNPQLRTRGGAPKRQRLVPPPANEPAAGSGPMLEVEDLRLAYRLGDREIRAVDGVSFTIPKGAASGSSARAAAARAASDRRSSRCFRRMPN